MKRLKIFMVGAVVASALTSCLGDGNSQSGFTGCNVPANAFANTPSANFVIGSYDNWKLALSGDASWVTPSIMSGNGMAVYTIPVTYKVNTTHALRSCTFNFRSVSGDGYMSAVLSQYGTRGDGSWGDAPLVKSIVAADESGNELGKVTLSYDEASRPTSVKMTKMASGAEETLRNLTMQWGDSAVTVGGDVSFSIDFLSGYQLPYEIKTQGDTLLYSFVGSSSSASGSYLAQLGEARINSEWTIYRPLYVAQMSSFYMDYAQNWADLDRKADSLTYEHHKGKETIMAEKLAVSYSSVDNRCQSVDANQLLLGLDECNPYLLLGLYRNLRSTAVIAEATSTTGKYAVATTLNADKSIATMTVTDKQGGKVTYTFTY